MWIDKIRARASENPKKIILPEGDDPRIVQAARKIKDLGIADVHVMSEYAIEGLQVIQETPDIIKATKMLSAGEFDGMVAGASHATAQVIRAALKNIGTLPDVTTISSFFLMESENKSLGESGAYLFADCAVIPVPDHKKLAAIAISTAASARSILSWEPSVALLSFSTKGSAVHEEVKKVQLAVQELNSMETDFLYDGELQLDAAIVSEIATSKDPGGVLGGAANILIFPDLNSGNIAYKIAQRLASMRAVGPILQGFKYPVNDLSRGCSVEDIVDVAAITVLQAAHVK